MAIFPKISAEKIIQVNDKTRILASQSYVSKDEAAISLIEIEPEALNGFIDVTGSDSDDWYLDWEYSTDGTKTITLRVTTDGSPVTFTKDIEVITEANDKLFSNDNDLKQHETSILKYLPKGKSSYNYVHRNAQNEILEQLYKDGYTDIDGNKFTKDSVVDIEEFRMWSKFMVLRMIFRDLSNAIDDIYDKKSLMYENSEHVWRTKAILKIDIDGDGDISDGEYLDITTRRLERR